ncbi:MAG: alkaline phosphatase [Phycisphaerae bacterium]|nr:alkaline phosphatase [Phycisphaerae bacterium]MDD5381405.1 alkaline phosphatase [Phycisphaerae bacterium]
MKNFTKTLTAIILSVVAFTVIFGCTHAETHKGDSAEKTGSLKSGQNLNDAKVKNIIFCIGDGMGLSQTALTRIQKLGPDGMLNMETMPVVGITRTHSLDSLATDSPAAGTALATGVKTNNGMIGMIPDGTKYQTILEAARDAGLRTGFAVNVQITDATPAAFGAHVKSRYEESVIAEQLLANKFNVLLGSRKEFFLPKTAHGSKREDNRNLIAEAKEMGYEYVETAEQLKSAAKPYLLGLFEHKSLTSEQPVPSLAEMTKKAIQILTANHEDSSAENSGFFLMVEGHQIDWACHLNDADKMVKQTLLFDEAVKVALDFASADGQTLVIVVADHETGGLTIRTKTYGEKAKAPYPVWSHDNHTGIPVPIYAYGPQAHIFTGVYDNTDVPRKFAKLLGITPFPKVFSEKQK